MSTVYLCIHLWVLQFLLSESWSFQCTDLLPPRYFMVLTAMCKGLFFYSFSGSLLLMYGNVTDFCMLILYPATTLNLFDSFFPLVGSLGFIYIRSCHLQTETILFLPFWLCACVLNHVWLFDPMDSVHRIFQARILKWVAISSSRRPSWPKDWTCVSFVFCIAGSVFTAEPPGKPFLSDWMPFISFSCLIALARISKVLLNKSD